MQTELEIIKLITIIMTEMSLSWINKVWKQENSFNKENAHKFIGTNKMWENIYLLLENVRNYLVFV